MLYRTVLLGLGFVLLGLGCNGQGNNTGSATPPADTKPKPITTRITPPYTGLTQPSAIEQLQAKGAVIIHAEGKPENPVWRVDLSGSKFGDDDLKLLAPFRFIHELNLARSKVTDAGLVQLTKFEQLFRIDLTDTGISDAGLVHLSKIRFLSRLRLAGTQVTDAGMTTLLNLGTLHTLDVRRTQVTSEGTGPLKQKSLTLHLVEDTRFVEFKSQDGRFEVEFPWSEPKARRRMQPSKFGVIQDTAYEVDWKKWSILVSVADLAEPGQPPVKSLEELVAAGRDEIAKQLGAKVAKEDRKDLGGGNVDWRITYSILNRPLQGDVYFRYVIQDRRLYTLGILINGDHVPEADRDRFFNSFRIVK